MFTIYGCSGHFGHVIKTICINFGYFIIRMLHMKFECKYLSGFCEKVLVWCMKFKKALNKEKNTPIVRKDENGLK